MNKYRNSGLDLVRVLALWCIMTCHFCSVYGNPLSEAIHDIFAVLGNSMFFILSGLLLGRKWRADGCPSYGFGFVIRRIKRLYPPFVVFVALYVVMLLCKGIEVPAWRILMNIGMLSWFSKLPGAGHLWFVTGMMILYFVFMGASRFGYGIRVRIEAWWIWLFVAVGIALVLLHFSGFRQTYFIVFVLGSLIAFLYGDDLSQRVGMIWGLGGIVFGVAVLVLLRDVETLNSIIAVLIALAAVALFARVDAGRCAGIMSWLGGGGGYRMKCILCIVFSKTLLFSISKLSAAMSIFSLLIMSRVRS